MVNKRVKKKKKSGKIHPLTYNFYNFISSNQKNPKQLKINPETPKPNLKHQSKSMKIQIKNKLKKKKTPRRQKDF